MASMDTRRAPTLASRPFLGYETCSHFAHSGGFPGSPGGCAAHPATPGWKARKAGVEA